MKTTRSSTRSISRTGSRCTIKDRRKVWITCQFLKIGSVDTIKQCFHGTVFVQALWREPSLDGQNSADNASLDFEQLWNPELDISNVMVEEKREVWRRAMNTKDGTAYVTEKRKIKAIFIETMELEEFPFDVQDLSILITTVLSKDEVDLCEDTGKVSKIDTNNFVEESEWTLRRFVHCEPRIMEDKYSRNDQQASGLYFRVCVIRRSGFFIWNNMLVMCIISSLSFTTFAVPKDMTAQRVELCFILLLAGVTFKFAASQAVPKISYLTHLDRYILGSMIFLFCVCIWHAVGFKFVHDISWDYIAAAVFAILYVLLQIIFVVRVFFQGRSRRLEIYQRERDYLERLTSSNDDKNNYTDKPIKA